MKLGEIMIPRQVSNRTTLYKRLTDVGGHPTGFDYLRVILASLVIASHTILISYGPEFTGLVWRSGFRPFLAIILPMFFSLSGFLVAGSLERSSTLISFVGLRVLRIFPALAVEVILSALVIGPVFTMVSLSAYFSDPMFHHYFLNMFGVIHFYLPGVFENNPVGRVNEQLWTVPWELRCYIALCGLVVLGFVKSAKWLSVATASFYIAAFLYYFVHGTPGTAVNGVSLIGCFLCGVLLFVLRDIVPWNGGLFVASFAISIGLMSFHPLGDWFQPITSAYATVYLGLLHPRRTLVIRNMDISYGLFLYGFPIQQSVVATMGTGGEKWYINLAVSWPLAAAFAVLSWFLVERPAMSLKPRLFAFERRATDVATGALGRLVMSRLRVCLVKN